MPKRVDFWRLRKEVARESEGLLSESAMESKVEDGVRPPPPG
jgi:hypothetical protein